MNTVLIGVEKRYVSDGARYVVATRNAGYDRIVFTKTKSDRSRNPIPPKVNPPCTIYLFNFKVLSACCGTSVVLILKIDDVLSGMDVWWTRQVNVANVLTMKKCEPSENLKSIFYEI